MSGRERTYTIRCANGGCHESTFYLYASQREYSELHKRQVANPWKCFRHRDPDANLRPGNESTETVLVATKVAAGPVPGFPDKGERWLPGLYWREEGAAAGSGLTHGPGFNAHASDFPEGTRLVVTARIEIPGGSHER